MFIVEVFITFLFHFVFACIYYTTTTTTTIDDISTEEAEGVNQPNENASGFYRPWEK